MADDFDDFVRRLQQDIFDQTKKSYGELGFERWLNPLYRGRMENPDGYACIRGNCGDTMEIFLRFQEDRVRSAAYQTDGCGAGIACGSVAAETLQEALHHYLQRNCKIGK